MISLYPEVLRLAKSKDYEKLGVSIRRCFLSEQQARPQLAVADLLDEMGFDVIEDASIAYLAVTLMVQSQGKLDSTIILQKRGADFKANFLLAHCLGHALLHLQFELLERSQTRAGFRETQYTLETFMQTDFTAAPVQKAALYEHEADLFAAALLLPQAMFVRAMQRLPRVQQVAEMFAVPAPFVVARKRCLGLDIMERAATRSDTSSPVSPRS
ncbi:MAG: ImmA/IrrE family metallo-endopeptidase [Zetaproteobacteria bacterium]|nr:ImmA/IrrE family metallo-endopeptidase [Zetaproteobacteria bacterium]